VQQPVVTSKLHAFTCLEAVCKGHKVAESPAHAHGAAGTALHHLTPPAQLHAYTLLSAHTGHVRGTACTTHEPTHCVAAHTQLPAPWNQRGNQICKTGMAA
jgi:hypothetical protein